MIVAEAAAAFPADGLRDAAGIFAVDHFLQARNDMGVAVLAQLHHDPAATHLVGDCTGGAGASEGVEDARFRINAYGSRGFNPLFGRQREAV